jgi:predicted nucleic acid-binding protein
MSLIVDASVAVKWLADEPGSDEARLLADGRDPLLAPTLLVVEVANALWKKCLRGLITRQHATSGSERLPSAFARLIHDDALSALALDLALDLDLKHPIYDCFYLALAKREDATLVTADARMREAAERARVKVRMI